MRDVKVLSMGERASSVSDFVSSSVIFGDRLCTG